jgi:hypothetical protein
MAGQVARQQVIDALHRMGLPQEADNALRELPDPVESEQVALFCDRHGLSRDELVSRMGGSP